MRPIFISLSPNVEKDDLFLALKLIFQPWKWKGSFNFLEEEFKKYFNVKYAFSFNSGRSALMAILSSLNLKKGSEVLLQAFTCNAAVNPILWLNLKPVFVDCDETLNIDIEDLKRKITLKSKVLMVQHTFGFPAKIEEILKICKEKNLILIEDCAHSLGATFEGKKIGTFGLASFFSFGKDKVISSVFGGMAITNDEKIGENLKKFWEKIKEPSFFWIFQQLLHPLLIELLIKPLYNFFGSGKILLFLFQNFKILPKSVSKEEKEGKKPGIFPKRIPKALAILAQNQLKKLEKFNEHRKRIAGIYREELKNIKAILPKEKEGRIWLKYPLIVDKETREILKEFEKKNIFLNDGWRETPIVPPDTNLKKMGYQWGSCPRAEKIAKSILNLPTHINVSEKEAQKITEFFKQTIK